MATPIIPQLNANSLQDISNKRGIKFEKRRPSKESLLEALTTEVEQQGIKSFVHTLKLPELQDLTAKIKKTKLSSNGANNPNTRAVLSKRLLEAMEAKGITEHITSCKLSDKQLNNLIEKMGVEVKEGKKADLVETVKTEILYMGLSAIFSNCSAKDLQMYAKDLGLSIESSAKTVLLRCILSQTNYSAADKPKVNRKPKEKKSKEEKADMAMNDDPEFAAPRPLPPKFDWEVSDDSDSEEFQAKGGPEDEDVEMSDVAPEDEDEAQDEEDEEEDGSEFENPDDE